MTLCSDPGTIATPFCYIYRLKTIGEGNLSGQAL